MENKPKTNRFLLSDEDRMAEDKFLAKFGGYKIMQPIDMVEPQSEERVNRIRRGIQRVEEEVGVMEDRGEYPIGLQTLVDAMEDMPDTPSQPEPMEMSWGNEEDVMEEPVPQQARSGSFDFRNER
jgi:hypothetical protein